MYDVIIVGAGPAGLTAGIYAARAGRDVLILEKTMTGGQAALTSEMENYPGFANGISGVDLAMAMAEQTLNMGAKIVYDGALEIDCAGRRVRTQGGWHEAKQLILALGAQPRLLGVPGEREFFGRGISVCATCDGAFYKGKRVAVIGGGNTAAEEALYLAGLGCDVQLVHRRDKLRAERVLAERVEAEPRITILWESWVLSFEGAKKIERMNLCKDKVEAIDGAFIAIGRTPDTALVRGQVDMDETGFIVAGEACQTSVPGVYVAGDARTKSLRQVVTAVADGAIAASAFTGLFE